MTQPIIQTWEANSGFNIKSKRIRVIFGPNGADSDNIRFQREDGTEGTMHRRMLDNFYHRVDALPEAA